jgi:hydrophobic/amphiphilic exporter-1 (mainly G- bacteria), HAE1 family
VLVANVQGRSVGSMVADLEHAAASLGLPAGYEMRIGGENQEIADSFRSLIIVIVLSLFMVFMILAAEYESIVYPLVILLTSPLAAIGAIFGMALAGQHFNVMSLVGLVIMIGAVDNDAVIVVDVIIGLRREGLAMREAILRGMRQRLRPILMTTATTVLGIIPLIFEFGTGSELVRALTVPIVGGLITSTVASILVIPVGVSFAERNGLERPEKEKGKGKEEKGNSKNEG